MSQVHASQDQLSWRKSSFSTAGGCIEVAPLGGGNLALRDSKNPDAGYFVYTEYEWHCFIRAVLAGEFDDLV
jgi:hypothetical protein